MSEFKPGLEGVIAFETEIAEPDRDGGALRYRGVDIEDLVGAVPFEKVWGLLVDEAPEPGLPPSEDLGEMRLTGDGPADLQIQTARLGAAWKLGQLIDITDDQAKEDLRRLSAAFLSIAALARRGRPTGTTTAIAPRRRRAGRDDRREVLARVARRGEPTSRPRARHLLDLHRRARVERLDLHRARRRLDRRRLRGDALGGGRRALGPASRRRSGAGAADARCRRCRELRPRLRGRAPRQRRADDGLRPSHLPRRGSARSPAARNLEGARLTAVRGRRGARAGCAGGAASPQARPRARDQRRVLVGGRARCRRGAPGARAGDVRLLAHGGLVGAHPRAEAPRAGSCVRRRSTSAPARGRSRRSSA